jgi:hypothetical protein
LGCEDGGMGTSRLVECPEEKLDEPGLRRSHLKSILDSLGERVHLNSQVFKNSLL